MALSEKLKNVKTTNTIELTILNGATASDWVTLPSSVLKVLGLKTPTNSPNTTLVFHVRTTDDESTIYPVASDTDIAAVLTFNVNGLAAFGARACAPLGSFVDGYHQLRLTIGTAITGDGVFILNVPSTVTE
jgi:hypothetical protein